VSAQEPGLENSGAARWKIAQWLEGAMRDELVAAAHERMLSRF